MSAGAQRVIRAYYPSHPAPVVANDCLQVECGAISSQDTGKGEARRAAE
jgi:hypothetical protein